LIFLCKRGDTFNFSYDVFTIDDQGNQLLYDFTNCVLRMQIKKSTTDKNVYIEPEIYAISNTLTINYPRRNMRAVDAGVYYYDIELDDLSGQSFTILYGTWKVLQDVTDFRDIYQVITNLNFIGLAEFQAYAKVRDSESLQFTDKIIFEVYKYFLERSDLHYNNRIDFDVFKWILIKTELDCKDELSFDCIKYILEDSNCYYNNELNFDSIKYILDALEIYCTNQLTFETLKMVIENSNVLFEGNSFYVGVLGDGLLSMFITQINIENLGHNTNYISFDSTITFHTEPKLA